MRKEFSQMPGKSEPANWSELRELSARDDDRPTGNAFWDPPSDRADRRGISEQPGISGQQ